jgi:hypothetical protein
MRERFDRALDRNPGYPPGCSLRDLENLNRRDPEMQRAKTGEVGAADDGEFKTTLRTVPLIWEICG